MNRTIKHGGRAWLQCLALVMLATSVSGCCKLFKICRDDDEALPSGNCTGPSCEFAASAMAMKSPCPTGQCNPDDNGRGIYKVEGSFHCFLSGTQERFCPQAFFNNPPNNFEPLPTVTLRGKDRRRDHESLHARVDNARLELPGGTVQDVRVLRIQAERTRLSITTCPRNANCRDTGNHTVHTGEALGRLTLQLYASGPVDRPALGFTYWVKLTPQGAAGAMAMQKYNVSYAEFDGISPPDQWHNHCEVSRDIGAFNAGAAFLPGWEVDGTTAAVTSSADAVTLACESGAIATCMDWGYTPWDPATGGTDPSRVYVFGACMQAKRAAYFGKDNDFASYTKNGTSINKRDQYGFGLRGNKAEDLPYLEAIWGPQGAVCLNPENRRRRKSVTIPERHSVPGCDKPPKWSLEGKFATSPAKLE